MNSVQLIGRLTRDPDADHTTSGTAVTTFRLAIDRPTHNDADFVTVKTWERLAEVTAEHLTCGRRVAVQGRLAHEEWLGSDGQRAERLTVVADRVEFLDAPSRASDSAGDRVVERATVTGGTAGGGAGRALGNRGSPGSAPMTAA
ncbi:MAG TPA: single-stranded DNA-binding protein [Egibacteraceae bacterium]|nr:single-stranded DNA-binding protein [Egibacteraceae bacterium]